MKNFLTSTRLAGLYSAVAFHNHIAGNHLDVLLVALFHFLPKASVLRMVSLLLVGLDAAVQHLVDLQYILQLGAHLVFLLTRYFYVLNIL
jgi:hypothetical protein